MAASYTPPGFVTGVLGKAVNWARTRSMWPANL